MKKIALVVLSGLLFMVSCDMGLSGYDPYDGDLYDYQVINRANVSVQIESINSAFDTKTIGSFSTDTVTSRYSNFAAVVVEQPNYKFRMARTGDGQYTVYQYENEVEYKISGTASSVDITLTNEYGNTEQYDNVSLPKIYSYKDFGDKFKYISAQNQHTVGTVRVEIFYQGQLVEESFSSGAYKISSASFYK